jgi:hypothetical protein
VVAHSDEVPAAQLLQRINEYSVQTRSVPAAHILQKILIAIPGDLAMLSTDYLINQTDITLVMSANDSLLSVERIRRLFLILSR